MIFKPCSTSPIWLFAISKIKRLLKEYFILKLRIKWLKDDKIPKSKYELLKSEGLLKDYENIDKLKNIEKMIRYV